MLYLKSNPPSVPKTPVSTHAPEAERARWQRGLSTGTGTSAVPATAEYLHSRPSDLRLRRSTKLRRAPRAAIRQPPSPSEASGASEEFHAGEF